MLIHKGWNTYIDDMREDIILNHPQISIQDFPFYNVSVFNDCESEMNVLMSIGHWSDVHPLLKLIPVNWEYTVPYGLMHSPYPSQQVEDFLSAVAKMCIRDSPSKAPDIPTGSAQITIRGYAIDSNSAAITI